MTFSPKIFYRMHADGTVYLTPCEVLHRMDHDLFEIRYQDPFLKETDGTYITMTKFVHLNDLMLPDEFSSL